MISTVLIVILVLVVGAHMADTIRVKQEEAILRRLPLEEAHAYYEVLRRRVRRVRVLRAVTLVSMVLVMVAARRRFFPPPPGTPAAADSPASTGPVSP